VSAGSVTRCGFDRRGRAFLLTCPRFVGPGLPTALA